MKLFALILLFCSQIAFSSNRLQCKPLTNEGSSNRPYLVIENTDTDLPTIGFFDGYGAHVSFREPESIHNANDHWIERLYRGTSSTGQRVLLVLKYQRNRLESFSFARVIEFLGDRPLGYKNYYCNRNQGEFF